MASYEVRRAPDYWLRGKPWWVRHELYLEMVHLMSGTYKRHKWLVARKRIKDCDEILY